VFLGFGDVQAAMVGGVKKQALNVITAALDVTINKRSNQCNTSPNGIKI